MGYEQRLFVDGSVFALIPQLTCKICQKVHLEPTETPCGHVFCRSCIASRVQQAGCCGECSCPLASANMLRHSMLMHNILNSLAMQCPRCFTQVSYSTLPQHDCSQQQNSVADFSSRLSGLQNHSAPQFSSRSEPHISLKQNDDILIADPPQQANTQSYRKTAPGVQSFGSKRNSQPNQQFSFPAISSTESSYSKNRVCRGCGGEGKQKDVNSRGLCSFCQKYQ
mmetsp:Transcript_25180/g.32037  ORF Transcript_25180/g.32037 Transcript_25180/m.32037 type:complete len:224 (-) Transcript_25180:16-687(-)